VKSPHWKSWSHLAIQPENRFRPRKVMETHKRREVRYGSQATGKSIHDNSLIKIYTKWIETYIWCRGGESENLENKQKDYRAMMERKTNLYNKLAQYTVVWRHDDWRSNWIRSNTDYAYHLEHSGEYSMMYSLNKSRFHKCRCWHTQ
jgi:hypothetical protein